MIAWIAAAVLAAAPVPAEPTIKERSAQTQVAIVDLNSADAEELMRLPGVGPKRAEAILARRSRGSFTRVTQLLEVKGIGKKTLERLRPYVRVAAAHAEGDRVITNPGGAARPGVGPRLTP